MQCSVHMVMSRGLAHLPCPWARSHLPHPHLPSDQTDVLQHTVNALGSLLGHPAILAQLQQASAAPVAEPGQDDAAMLQLEALHALLLILPLPEVGYFGACVVSCDADVSSRGVPSGFHMIPLHDSGIHTLRDSILPCTH